MAGVAAGSLHIEILTNVAKLQQEMQQIKKSVGDMTGGVGSSVKAANDNLGKLGTTLGGRIAPSAKQVQMGFKNLAFQTQDLGVQFAMAANSANPLKGVLMALVMQGPQIKDALNQTGMSLGTIIKNGVRAHPVMAGLAAVTAVAAGGLTLFGKSLDDGQLTKFQNSLGLTKKELEKLGPASITMGDIFKGAWKTVYDALNLGPYLEAVKANFASFTSFLVTAIKYTAAGIYAAFVGTFNGVVATWKMLPGLLGEAAVGAVNLVIGALERMANGALDLLRSIASPVNAVLEMVGMSTITALDGVTVTLDRMENQFAGSGAKAAGAFGASYSAAFSDALAAMAGLGKTLGENIVGAAKDRISKQAQELIDDRTAKKDAQKKGKKVGDEFAKALKEAMKGGAEYIAGLFDEIAKMGKNPIELKGMEVAAEQAKVLKYGLTELAAEIGKAGAAWVAAFRAQADRDFDADTIRPLEQQVQLLGEVGRARRDLALALEEEAFKAELVAKGVTDVNAAWESYFKLKTAINSGEDTLADDLMAIDADLRALDLLEERANNVADTIGNAFGKAGQAIGSMISEYAAYTTNRLRGEQELAKVKKEHGEASLEYYYKEGEIAAQNANARDAMFGNMLQSAKGFFKEQSTGYKIITGLEKVYAAIKFANMIKGMVLDKTSTVSSIGNAIARGAADAAAGAAKIFSSLGPLGFPVVAAMVAVLASMGLRGLKGGGGGPKIPSAADVQAAQGTGSVLGAGDQKSSSLSNSLAIVAKNSNRDLEYSNLMVRHLRAIEGNIGNLTSAIARQMGVSGGGFGTEGLGLGENKGMSTVGKFMMPGAGLLSKIPVIGGAFDTIAKALFGTKKTVTLLDQGLTFANQTVDEVLNRGIEGLVYNVTQTTKKSKFFGISTGSKTSTSQQTAGLDDELERQVTLIIGSLRSGVLAAAGALGVEGAAATLGSFQVAIGKISTLGLSGEDIERELQAVFSKLGDDMVTAVLPGLTELQRAGEGLFETLARVARQYQVVDVTLQSIGKTFGAVGLSSLAARESLVGLFGSLDDFVEQTNYFRDNFLSEAERMAPIQAAVAAEMARLGQAGVDTKEEFKNLVLGLDLSTDAGQAMYAALMAVAPAFSKAVEYQNSLTGAVEETAKTVVDLAAIAKQQRGLEIQLMEAQGKTAEALAAKRADELAGMDASLRGLQEAVWAAQDAANAERELSAERERAADAAKRIADQRRNLEIELLEATGKTSEALAARRELELATMDVSLHELQKQVWAAQDAARANGGLTDSVDDLGKAAREAAEAAEKLAAQRRNMEIELMEALGQSTEALAARRALELAALDASLHELQKQIWAAQDAAKAQDALAAAERDAAKAAEEAAAASQRLADQRRDLEVRLLELQGRSVEALAIKRQQEIAAADESLRSLIAQIHAQEDANRAAEEAAKAADAQAKAAEDAARAAEELAKAQADAARAAAELMRQQRSLEAEIMELQGNAAGALAIQRQLELEAMDESLRPLQILIYQLRDQAAAAEEAARASEDAARAAEERARAEADAVQAALELQRQRSALQVQILDLEGRSLEAVALQRQLELAAMDASLRPLQERIYQLLDERKAAEIAAEAAAETARAQEEAARLVEEANRRALDIARQRSGLEIQYMELTGDSLGALAAQRALELAAMDESLRPLQSLVWSLQDAKAAADAAAQAQSDAARAAEELARAQADATREAIELARSRGALEIEILELQGDAAGALAMRRAAELEAMDASLRPLQEIVYRLTDQRAATEAAAQAAAEAARAADELARAQDEAARSALEAAEAQAQLSRQRRGLEAEILELQGNAAGALAIRRQLELEAMDASLHPLQQLIYSLRDAADATGGLVDATDAERRAAELARQRRTLEAELLDAQGDAIGAVTIRRELELAALDATLIGIQQQIYAALDQRAAAEEAARAQENAARMAEEAARAAEDAARAALEMARTRRGLEAQIMELSGNAAGALAVRRELELSSMDASLHALQRQIYALEDQRAAADAAANALDAFGRTMAEAAQAAAQIATQRRGLEIRIMELQGRELDALNARREDEIGGLDSSLHALQKQIYALEDQRAAAEASRAAQEDYARSMADAARAAEDAARAQEEAARAAEERARQAMGLQAQILELQGRTSEALALRRRLELSAMDGALRGLQMQIYALEDAKAAAEAAAKAEAERTDRINDARNELSTAYNRESEALRGTIDRFRDFGASLREFRDSLFASAGGASSYRRAQAEFIETARLAATGDATALGGLQGAGSAFLEVSKAQATSIQQYRRDVALVASGVEKAIGASDEAVDYAELQLAALDQSVAGLIEINESVKTVAEAIAELQAAMGGGAPIVAGSSVPIVQAAPGAIGAVSTSTVMATNDQLRGEVSGLRADLNAALLAIKQDTGRTARVLERVDAGDSLRVSNDADTPLTTVAGA